LKETIVRTIGILVFLATVAATVSALVHLFATGGTSPA
jgi:hypothetical protein